MTIISRIFTNIFLSQLYPMNTYMFFMIIFKILAYANFKPVVIWNIGIFWLVHLTIRLTCFSLVKWVFVFGRFVFLLMARQDLVKPLPWWVDQKPLSRRAWFHGHWNKYFKQVKPWKPKAGDLKCRQVARLSFFPFKIKDNVEMSALCTYMYVIQLFPKCMFL